MTWATLSHLAWLLSSFVGVPPLGPLVVYLVLQDRGPFVRHHSAQALSFQLSLLVYVLVVGFAGGALTLVTFGAAFPLLFGALLVLVAVGLVLSVVAAVAANNGRWYQYPLTIPFVR